MTAFAAGEAPRGGSQGRWAAEGLLPAGRFALGASHDDFALAGIALRRSLRVPISAGRSPSERLLEDGSLVAAVRTAEPRSGVTPQRLSIVEGAKFEGPWRAFRVRGTRDFAHTGILAGLATRRPRVPRSRCPPCRRSTRTRSRPCRSASGGDGSAPSGRVCLGA